ncbi:MAG: hypothetical protein ACUVRO_12405, partial [Armatimonadota bacterium]
MANGGIRIPDLARELRVRVADIERALADMGVRVRGPNSVLDVRLATRVRERLRANGGPTQRSRPAQQRREVELFDGITVRELADKLSVGTAEVQKALLSRGILAPLNHQLSYAEAADLARGMGYTVKEQTE